MLGALDHVGYLTDDLDRAVAEFTARFSLPVARTLELPQFSIQAVFLGPGTGCIELFTLTDDRLLEDRLGGQSILLDHAAHGVEDIDATVAQLAGNGVRFSGPDRRQVVREPLALGGGRHIWTIPESSCGQSLQIIQL